MEQQGLSKRDIQVITHAHRGHYAIKIYSVEPGLWRMDIMLSSPTKCFPAYTQRGALKTWRDLAGAVCYACEVCPECPHVEIEIGCWKFTKVPDNG